MLDIHTHILPGVDDGSRSVEQSIKMLQAETAQGVDTVALTPHFYAEKESPESFIRRRNTAFRGMLRELRDIENVPDLMLGAEVFYFDGMSRFEDIETLCIGDTKVLLIEMPFSKWNQRIIGEVKELRELRGVRPVLAHVERYKPFHKPGLLEELSDCGIRLQINASHILNWQTSMQAMAMIKRNGVDFIASDCHGLQHRPPELGAAIEKTEKKLGRQALEFLQRSEEWLLGGME